MMMHRFFKNAAVMVGIGATTAAIASKTVEDTLKASKKPMTWGFAPTLKGGIPVLVSAKAQPMEAPKFSSSTPLKP